jgi:4'-phosphopantetheinyl transferase
VTATPPVTIWTMAVAGIAERDVIAWRDLLDETEQARAARFVFERHRVTYIAAHALVRAALSSIDNGSPPRSWTFTGGGHGKPTARVGDRQPLIFNLSHTEGMVGLAATKFTNGNLGFDLESLNRSVTLAVADRYFCPEEIAWLKQQPQAEQPHGFLRLWTLKEAFIKATGEGLSRDLASFWFEPLIPRVHFKATPDQKPEDWYFEQRVIGDGDFIAAVGLEFETPASAPEGTGADSRGLRTNWIQVSAEKFLANPALSGV